MLVDEYEQYQNNNDRTDVVVVSRSGSEEPEPEPEPLANDRKGIHFPFHHLRHASTPVFPAYREPRNGAVGMATHLLLAIYTPGAAIGE